MSDKFEKVYKCRMSELTYQLFIYAVLYIKQGTSGPVGAKKNRRNTSK